MGKPVIKKKKDIIDPVIEQKKAKRRDQLRGELRSSTPDQSFPAILERLEKIEKYLNIKDVDISNME